MFSKKRVRQELMTWARTDLFMYVVVSFTLDLWR